MVRNERIINNSVARLRPHHAAALLECAVERLRARARRGPELTVWIRAVLTYHTAYLMAAPGVLPILATLSQVTIRRDALTVKVQDLRRLPRSRTGDRGQRRVAIPWTCRLAGCFVQPVFLCPLEILG